MPPNYSLNGARNRHIAAELGTWAAARRGAVAGASTGLVLPNGARRSPDAAWISPETLATLPSLEGYWNVCPDFVIELRTHYERLPDLRNKMREWIANGAHLGWMIDPDTRTVEIYRPDREPELISGDSVQGERPVEGFTLHLQRIWNPLA